MIDLSKYDKDTMFIFNDGSIGTGLTVENVFGIFDDDIYKYKIKIISDISDSMEVPYALTFNKKGAWVGSTSNLYIVEII